MELPVERWRCAPDRKYAMQVILTGQLYEAWQSYEQANPDQKFSVFVRRLLREQLKHYITDRPK